MLTIAALAALSGAVALAPTSSSTPTTADRGIDSPSFEVISDTEIHADGQVYHSWQELYESGYYNTVDTKCGTRPIFDAQSDAARGGSDCTYSRTNIRSQYDPSVAKYRIPVVVHVIMRTNGTGALSDARIQSQIDILNEDFQAMAGTNGAPGNDGQIEFYLATEDPNGNPTTGITRSTNNTWYNDGGAYYNTLAWDTNHYLNIYTNSASGNLGYVPDLPQGGIAGSKADRVVILDSTFGRNAPFSPYNLGRTVTHEVGHYLGLYHTFEGGCSNSYTSGDRIVDTHSESSPTFGCPGSRSSCGGPAPFHNYMDYSDDACMWEFTVEQNNRMRCSLLTYRPNLYTIAGGNGACSDADLAEPFGSLDFFDVSAFLAAFGSQNADADLNGDGTWDFFDVSAYLASYAAGCP
ncbi:MAG: M43 family zinc metalloprotease [Phycisphaerales bacterium]